MRTFEGHHASSHEVRGWHAYVLWLVLLGLIGALLLLILLPRRAGPSGTATGGVTPESPPPAAVQ